MNDNETLENDSLETLQRIRTVCKSMFLSKDAKLAYVMLSVNNAMDVKQCYCDPPEDTINGLYELAHAGLIALEIDGNMFSSRLKQYSPAFLPARKPYRTPDIRLQSPLPDV